MALLVIHCLAGCASPHPKSSPKAAFGSSVGVASYYGKKYHGRKTASGEQFDMNKMTAAHRTIAFGERVRVTNLENQKTAVVQINDRGPYAKDRMIDVSLAAARQLDMVKRGTAPVRIDRVD